MAVGEEKAAAASNTPLFCCEEMRGVLALSFTMDVCLNSQSERCFIPSVWVIYIHIYMYIWGVTLSVLLSLDVVNAMMFDQF